jgi:hypothetical protein
MPFIHFEILHSTVKKEKKKNLLDRQFKPVVVQCLFDRPSHLVQGDPVETDIHRRQA